MLWLFLPAVSYILVSTFTPGPSNLSTASQAVVYGYGNTLRFQAGLALGVGLLMTLSGAITALLLNVVPLVEPALRILGAAYILYLAAGVLKASYAFEQRPSQPLGLKHGLALQLLNPKLFVYAFSLFTGFLASLAHNITLVILAAVLLAAVSFAATSAWALFGALIRSSLRHPRRAAIVNAALALALVYSALALLQLI